ncbi:hypothetical protein [Ensifer aridi]|uniref:hypothetical protein n=1 Tax=Ensifer aridi TaxID=1708715 RepID=UPI000A1225BC|nr:hypothetical protein [Ensifer aridi]
MKYLVVASLVFSVTAPAFAETKINVRIEPNTEYTILSAFQGFVEDAKSAGSFLKGQQKVPEEWWLSPFISQEAMEWSIKGAQKNAVMRIVTNDVTGFSRETTERNNKIRDAALSNNAPLSVSIYPPHYFFELSDFALETNFAKARLYRATLTELTSANGDDYLLGEFDNFVKGSGSTPTIDSILHRIMSYPEFKTTSYVDAKAAMVENINYIRRVREKFDYKLRKWHYGASSWLPNNISIISQHRTGEPKTGVIEMTYGRSSVSDFCNSGTDIELLLAYWKGNSVPGYWDLNDRVFLSQLADKTRVSVLPLSQLEDVHRALVKDAQEALKQIASACAIERAAGSTVWELYSSRDWAGVIPIKFRAYLDLELQEGVTAEIKPEEYSEALRVLKTLLRTDLKDGFNRYYDRGAIAWLAVELLPPRDFRGTYLRLFEERSRVYAREGSSPAGSRYDLISLRSWNRGANVFGRDDLHRQPEANDPMRRLEQMQSAAYFRANATQKSLEKYGIGSFPSAVEAASREFVAQQIDIANKALEMLKEREASEERLTALMLAYRYGFAYVPDDSILVAVHKGDGDFVKVGEELFSVVPRFQFNASFELSAGQLQQLAITPRTRRFISLTCKAPDVKSEKQYGLGYLSNLRMEVQIADIKKSLVAEDRYSLFATLSFPESDRPRFDEKMKSPIDDELPETFVYSAPLLSAGMKCTTDFVENE